jgi:glycolate oxidase FAD binding subunit
VIGATVLTATARATWPDPPAAGAIGDGRAALADYRPLDVDPLCQLVREQVGLGHAIYPQGGGTALDYGGIPRRPGVIINTRGLDRLIDYPFADMTITVQAGMTLSALRAILTEKHQRVLVDAPHPDRATLGGMYATNTTGPRRYGAGRPRDQIIGVSFVTSEGVVVKGGGRVVKNVAGYDFPKLLTGSMGTLGILTQLTVKVRPIPEASAIAWISFSGEDRVAAAIDGFNLSGTQPTALELLNRPAAGAIGQSLGLPRDQAVLAIGLEDNAESVRWQIDRLKTELGRTELLVVDGEQAASLWESLTAFQAGSFGPISFVANLRPSSIAAFVAGLDPERWSVQAHAGNGIVRAHGLDQWTLDEATRQIDPLRRWAVADGGNLIVSRCPTEWKESLRVWGEPRADWAIAERVRAALDPHRAMNPGRFVVG